MYLTRAQLRNFLKALDKKYRALHILMDVYTEFGAIASKYRNPVNDVGVTRLYGVDDIGKSDQRAADQSQQRAQLYAESAGE
jgi:hypothetical protein